MKQPKYKKGQTILTKAGYAGVITRVTDYGKYVVYCWQNNNRRGCTREDDIIKLIK